MKDPHYPAMDKERLAFLHSVADRLATLPAHDRTAALTHLYALRTAAVQDLSDPDAAPHHWDDALDTASPLVRDLLQLTAAELSFVSAQVAERSSAHAPHTAADTPPQTAADTPALASPTQSAASDVNSAASFATARHTLELEYKAAIAERMRGVRDAIERAVEGGTEVAALEEVFGRLERAFWEGRGVSEEELWCGVVAQD